MGQVGASVLLVKPTYTGVDKVCTPGRQREGDSYALRVIIGESRMGDRIYAQRGCIGVAGLLVVPTVCCSAAAHTLPRMYVLCVCACACPSVLIPCILVTLPVKARLCRQLISFPLGEGKNIV